MQDKQGLRTNPFYILHALPSEPDQKLLERVQERKLLYGISADEAETLKNALLHPGSRLAAEIGFLPDTPADEVDALRIWLERAEQIRRKTGIVTDAEGEERLPGPADFYAPRSSLAMLNGAASMLQYWSVRTPARACAACLSLILLLNQVRPDTVQEEINRDRAAAGHQTEESLPAVAARLQEHKEAILSALAERCMESLSPEAFRKLRLMLAQQYIIPDNPDFFRSYILDELVCRHLRHAGAAEVNYYRTEVVRVMEEYKKAESGESDGQSPGSGKKSQPSSGSVSAKVIKRRKKQHDRLLELLHAWKDMTIPERVITQSKGYMDHDAQKLMKQVNEFRFFMVGTSHDYRGGSMLANSMEELFFDMPQN